MSFRPSAKKALKAYGGSRAGRAADQREMLNKVARAVSQQGLRPPRLSAVSQQALRVGGWASPSRMGELKFTDVNTVATVPTSPNFAGGILLNGLVPGSLATQRIGRKIVLKSLLMRYRGNIATTSVGGGVVRMMIIYDKQANATAPTILDILERDDFTSPNNLSNRDRFVTLCDHMSPAVSQNGDQSIASVVYKPLNLETMFNDGVAGTVGDITSGSIYFFYAQTSGITVTGPNFEWDFRVRYADM